MRQYLLVTFDQIYDEPIRPKEEYLAGIDRPTLLQIANYLLNIQQLEDFRKTFPRVFGHHNREEAERIYRKLEQIERQTNALVSIAAPESALKIFQLIFPRPDEPATQSEVEIEQNLFRLFFAVNDEVVNAENTSLDNAPELPGVDRFARLALLNSHSRFDINQEGIEKLMISQMAKSIQLFTFLQEREKYHDLLAAFLKNMECETWQEYSRRIFSLIKIIWDQTKSNSTGTIVVQEEDDRRFLDHFILADGANLITDDYFSVRETPLFKLNEREYVVVYPRFVVEMLHKGLYWRIKKLNDASGRALLKGEEWGTLYKKEFSEEYMLNPIMDAIYKKRGIAISGKEMEDSGILADDGGVEPDYYFRETKRVIILESKDVDINKVFKKGDNFSGFVDELGSKFFRRSTDPVTDRLSKTAVLQLLRNIQRVLSGNAAYDKIAQPNHLIIYPILLVHNSVYNMPGLNALVDSWLQQELIRLRAKGLIAQHGRVRPITIIDIDTLITYQDHLIANKKLRLLDLLEQYYLYGKGRERGSNPKNQQDLIARVMKGTKPFAQFLEGYASSKGIAPVSDTQVGIVRNYLLANGGK
ncbi:hypothetical protein K3G63_04625 [Hymenobacter sp. HSC-4F20]|uniref:hypothetical protein n=1 Tax=Hymenobacter sp. HSC-4F20 TaxID=2864135 RepID=UPI001C72D520|nr:hypothetical protein [Hymenobacter sp. HSC-4F20]MBX0289708.1 hypothetical protein [Hymenobacter sp. HSC-4F20]